MKLSTLKSLREGSKLEIKNGSGGIPKSLWETYSSFSNTDGGTIILGLEEKDSNTYLPVALNNLEQIIQNLWDLLNNKQKVSKNILSDNNIRIDNYEGSPIIVIEVPRANREDRPIYVKGNFLTGTYRRDGEGDYRCSEEEIRMMLRDATTEALDRKIVESLGIEALCEETIRKYRNKLNSLKPTFMWNNLSDEEFLYRINAIGRGKENNTIHPTLAGLLMFGYHNTITQECPDYFLDYREVINPSIRWNDRLTSDSGIWSGNIYDFFILVDQKLSLNLKTPFKMMGSYRVDDTPLHKAVRESLVNTLVHANYYERRGITIINQGNKFIFSNPGLMRMSVDDAIQGGISDPRNQTLFTMFTLINLGERAGSGLSSIYSFWEDLGWDKPRITQISPPERTTLELSFYPIEELVISEVQDSAQSFGPLSSQMQEIYNSVLLNGQIVNNDVQKLLGIKQSRANELLQEMVSLGILNAEGSTRSRIYTINQRVPAGE